MSGSEARASTTDWGPRPCLGREGEALHPADTLSDGANGEERDAAHFAGHNDDASFCRLKRRRQRQLIKSLLFGSERIVVGADMEAAMTCASLFVVMRIYATGHSPGSLGRCS
jgi:hypothetical protein